MKKKKLLRRVLSAVTVLSMCASMTAVVNAEGGKAVCTNFEFQNEEGETIKSFGADTVAIIGNAVVENNTDADINPYVFVTVKRGGKLVKIVSDTKPIASGKSGELAAILENSDDFTLSEDDTVKAMVWNGMTEQSPLAEAIDLSSKYSTNNVTDFNFTENILGADRWSYLYSNTNTASDGEISTELMNDANDPGFWFLSADKNDNWFLSSEGKTSTEWGRDLIYNYTVGPKTAGKDIKISGNFTDEAYGGDSIISVIKTNDTDTESVEEISSDVITRTYFSKSVSELPDDGSFSLTIPASEVKEGNDIMFVISCQAGGYVWNQTEVTIEAEKPAAVAEIKTNTVDNYMSESNEIVPGRWSYLVNAGRLLNQNLFSYAVMTANSDGSWLQTADKNWWNLLNDSGVYTDQHVTMMYNYTIDESMAGKELRIKGRLSGEDGRLAIFASKDTDLNSIEFGANMWTACYGKFSNYTYTEGSVCSETDGYTNVSDNNNIFEAVIPAGAVNAGTDIIFAVESEYNYGDGDEQTMSPTNFVGIITASDKQTIDPKTKFEADSVLGFETETNATRPGHWSYYHLTETVTEEMDDEEIITGVKVNNLLKNGNEGSNNEYAGTWAADPNRDEYVHVIGNREFRTDARSLAWVYTVKADDFKNAGNGASVSGQIGLDTIGARVQIFCVNDGLANEVSSEVQPLVLYDKTLSQFSETSISDIHIPKKYLKEGTDIIFRVTRTSNDIWCVGQSAAFNICEY